MYESYGYGLDVEECMTVSWLAYLQVRQVMGDIYNTDRLWGLVGRKIFLDLKNLRRARNARYGLESRRSFNQTIGESKKPVYTFLFPARGDFTNSVCMWIDIQRLGREKEFVARKLYQGEEDPDIMRMLHMRPDEYYELKLRLKEDILKYFAE